MTRKVLVQSYRDTPTSPILGKVIKPQYFTDISRYAEAHTNAVTGTFLSGGADSPLVGGFDALGYSGLEMEIGHGRVFDADGVMYETVFADDRTSLVFEAADASNPRIDSVVALIERDVPAALDHVSFRRLLQVHERLAGVAEYDPTPREVPNELHTRATIRIKKGDASAVPTPKLLNANEVLLYIARVAPGAVALVPADDVTDRRNRSRTLVEAWGQLDALTAGGLNEVIDDRLATTLANGYGLIENYDDPGNFLGYSVDATSLNIADKIVKRDASGDTQARRYVAVEQLQSLVATGTPPLSVQSQTLVPNFNSERVGGQTLADLDSRFVNTSGDAITLAANGAVVRRGLSVTAQKPNGSPNSTINTGIYGRAFYTNYGESRGGDFEAFTPAAEIGADAHATVIGVRGYAGGAGTDGRFIGVYGGVDPNAGTGGSIRLAAQFVGDVQVSGHEAVIATDPTKPALSAQMAAGQTRNPIEVRNSTGATIAYCSPSGVWTNASSRDLKEGFVAEEDDSLLARVRDLGLYRYSYKAEPGVTHFGATAEEFRSIFGYGADDRTVSALDVASVALGAVQALLKLIDRHTTQAVQLENCGA